MAKLVLDEPETKPKLVLDEPTDFGMIALPREELPGVWDYDKQLDSLLGDDKNIEDFIPWDVKYDFGRIVGMTEKPDETKDKMATSLFYSVELGIPPSVSFSILDELNKIAFDGTLPASTAWGRIKQRYKTGKAQVQIMDIGYDILRGTWQDWEKYDNNIKNIEKLQSGMTIDQQKEFRGFFEKLVGASAELAPFGLEAAKEMPVGAAIGGTIFGIGAALVTGAIPTIGEEVIIPPAIIAGMKLGAGVKGAIRVGELEAGGMFLELAQMKDQYGNRIDPKIAVVASHAVGAINGGIELAEWQVLLGTFGLGKKLFDKSVRKVTHRLFTQGTIKELIARKMLDYSIALGAETLQEIEQETTSIVFGELAKELNDARKGTDFKPITAEALKERYREVTVESMRAFGLMVLPGTTISGALELVAQKKEVAAKPVGKAEVVEIKAPEQDVVKDVADKFDISEEKARAILERQAELQRQKAEVPPTEAIVVPEKPVEAITTKIDRLQSEVDVFTEKGQKPPTELISEINAAKKELRQKPLEITGIKAKVLGKAEIAPVTPERVGITAKDKLIVERGGEITVSAGEAGRGVYAFIPSAKMREYYTSRGEKLQRIELDRDKVVDLTKDPEQTKLIEFAKTEIARLEKEIEGYIPPKINKSNIQRFGRIIEQYIEQNHPEADAYILSHKGPGIPTGKQVIIRKEEALAPVTQPEAKIVYHTSAKPEGDFKFLKSMATYGGDKVGVHFGTKEQAESVAKDKGGKVIKYQLNLKNPLRLKDLGNWSHSSILRAMKEVGVIDNTEWESYAFGKEEYDVREILEAHGYDSIVYENEVEGKGDTFIALRPEQVQQAKPVAPITPEKAVEVAVKGKGLIRQVDGKWQVKFPESTEYTNLAGEFETKTAEQVIERLKALPTNKGIEFELAKPKAVEVIPFEKQIRAMSDTDLGKSLNRMIKIRSEIPDVLIEQWRIEDTDRKIDLMQKEWQRRGKKPKVVEVEKVEPEKSKLRQKIHAIAAVKGLTKKALEELKKKHTGYRKLTGKIASKKITTEQLQNLLKAVQRARPKRVGYKRVITKKTEKKIQSLKENLIKKTQMTERHYDEILEIEVHGKEPKYTDAKNFITETQGKDILRRMLDTAEIVRLTESFEQAIAKNPEIADRVKLLDSRIEKAPKRDPYSLESMRYYNQQAQIKTGAPIFTSYMDLMDTHLEITKTRAATWKRLENATEKFKEIAKDEEALQRVSDYIASQSTLKEKPAIPEDVTTDEIKLAKEIQKILEEYRLKVRVTKFYNWYYYNQPIPDHDRYTREITKAVDIYESKGKEELIEYLETQEWGIVKSGYEPLEILFHKIRPYTTGPTAVGKGHIKIRTDIEYHKQERNILQRLSSYMRQIDTLYNLSPKINAYIRLFDDNASKFSDWGKVKGDIEIFLRNLKRYNIEGGFFERTIARAYSQAMRVIIMPSPVLAFRNLFQNAAFEHDKTILIDPRNTKLSSKDIEYLETYILQTRAMVEEYFMVGEKPLPGLGFLTKLIDKVKIYPYSDIANRHWSFWAKTNQVERALKAETTKQMMTEARFEDMKELEQRRALGILARDGKEAMAQYIGRVHVDDIHFLYERSQRSPAEMTSLGKIVGNLMLFPRAYGEKLAHAANKTLKGKTYEEQWRGLKTIFAVIGGGLIVGSIYMKVTGRKRNPYNPLEVLAFRPGGLAWGSIEAVTEVYANILSAAKGDSRALAALTVAIPRAADMFIPFYDYALRAIEAATDQKNIDRKALRQMRMLIDKEYKIRGGAYEVKRNALEKWQYFLSGPSAEKEKEVARPKKITR